VVNAHEKQVRGLRQQVFQVIRQELQTNKRLTDADREALMTMARNAARIGIVLRPGHALEQRGGTITKGVHIQSPTGEIIEATLNEVFEGNRLKYGGVLTLLHEWAHNPARFQLAPSERARSLMEESMADYLAVNIGLRMGFPPKAVYEHLLGRSGFVYEGIRRGLMRRALQEAKRRRPLFPFHFFRRPERGKPNRGRLIGLPVRQRSGKILSMRARRKAG